MQVDDINIKIYIYVYVYIYIYLYIYEPIKTSGNVASLEDKPSTQENRAFPSLFKFILHCKPLIGKQCP